MHINSIKKYERADTLRTLEKLHQESEWQIFYEIIEINSNIKKDSCLVEGIINASD